MGAIALVFGFAGLGTTSCNKSESAASKYTCPMHPEVVADKPGNCSKCNMALVEKK